MADVKITTSLEGVNQVKAGMSSMGDHAKTIGRIIGTAFAGIGFSALIKSTIDAGDEIQKLSIKLGASTEALSQYRHMAQLSGVSFQQLSLGWQYMSRSVSEAAQGTGTAVDALDELGLSAKKLKLLAPEQQFEVLADALGQVENASDKTRLAADLFGARQTALLQVMEGGSEVMRAARAEADSYGLTLSRTSANQMAEFNDGLTRMKNAGLGFINMLTVYMGPSLASIGKFLGEVLPKAAGFFADAINGMRIFALKGVEGILEGLQWVLDKLGKLPGAAGEAAREASKSLGDISTHVGILAEEYTVATMQVEDFAIEQGVAVDAMRLSSNETNRNTETVKENTKAVEAAKEEGVSYGEAMRRVKEAEEENNRAKERAIEAYKEWLEPAGMTIDATGEIVDINKKAIPIIHDHTDAVKELGDEYEREQARTQDWGKIFRQEHHNVYDTVADIVWGIKGAWHGFFEAVIADGSSFKGAVSALWDDIKRVILRKIAEIVADGIWNQLAALISGKTSQLNNLFSMITSAGGSVKGGLSLPAIGGTAAIEAGVAGAVIGGAAVILDRNEQKTGSAFAGNIAGPTGSQMSTTTNGSIKLWSPELASATGANVLASYNVYNGEGLALTAAGGNIDQASAKEALESAGLWMRSQFNSASKGLTSSQMASLARSIFRNNVWNLALSVSGSSNDIRNSIVGKFNQAMSLGVRNFESAWGVDIPGFATGGRAMFSRPSLISVAENGPELIEATPAASGGKRGQGSIVFNGPVFLDEITYNRMSRGMLAGLEQAGSRF